MGVYTDEAQPGTRDARENFQRMIADAKAGQIDLIITKSISRFARNTLTLLQTVRELKAIGVDVFFEEQNVHTISAEGELMLTLLASFAQEESLSVSENLKWRIKKNFEAGIPWGGTMLSYRFKDGKYVVIPEDVPVVQFIFREYLAGKGLMAIAKELNDMGAVTRLPHTPGYQRTMTNSSRPTRPRSIITPTSSSETLNGNMPGLTATKASQA